ncbi:hypothetical protein QFZ20_005307 [Flavobacterium sp. W4I14]|nr:hypothetical protein [Flavobacterium sp. W4I14]
MFNNTLISTKNINNSWDFNIKISSEFSILYTFLLVLGRKTENL